MTALNVHHFISSLLFGLSSASVKKMSLVGEENNRNCASDTAFQLGFGRERTFCHYVWQLKVARLV